MRIFAVGDLHLPGGQDKLMDIFGDCWQDHFSQISADWRVRVGDEDIVLVPGDISWAITLDNARADLNAIGELPGRIVMIKGNHDYWWSSITQVRGVLREGFYALQNDAVLLDGMLIAGTRGWPCPGGREYDKQDEKLYQREAGRLALSLAAARKLDPCAPIIAMTHFPPFNERQDFSDFMALFEEYKVTTVFYGHLHGRSIHNAFRGVINGVEYRLVSCDSRGFALDMVDYGDFCVECFANK